MAYFLVNLITAVVPKHLAFSPSTILDLLKESYALKMSISCQTLKTVQQYERGVKEGRKNQTEKKMI